MKSGSITYTKNNFSAVVREVVGGERYVVCDYGRPVAEIRPIGANQVGVAQTELDALERQGTVSRGLAPLPEGFFSATLRRAADGSSTIDALIAERETAR